MSVQITTIIQGQCCFWCLLFRSNVANMCDDTLPNVCGCFRQHWYNDKDYMPTNTMRGLSLNNIARKCQQIMATMTILKIVTWWPRASTPKGIDVLMSSAGTWGKGDTFCTWARRRSDIHLSPLELKVWVNGAPQMDGRQMRSETNKNWSKTRRENVDKGW